MTFVEFKPESKFDQSQTTFAQCTNNYCYFKKPNHLINESRIHSRSMMFINIIFQHAKCKAPNIVILIPSIYLRSVNNIKCKIINLYNN